MHTLTFRRVGSLLCLLSVLITGCGIGNAGVPEQASESASTARPDPVVTPSSGSEEDWKVEELPYAYTAMQQDVVIQLKEEPSLQSPIRTIVGMDPQAYVFFFRQPMEPSSVEKAIQEQIKPDMLLPDEKNFLQPALKFHWIHDQQLHVQVSLPIESVLGRDWLEYRLTAAGAQTVKGTSLAEDSADFQAVVLQPGQVWRIALDGKEREKLTDFTTSYLTEMLDADGRFFLLSRFQYYCECDALSPKLFSVYDSNTGTFIRYPVELFRDYRGKGEFVADRRGFFYEKPADGVTVPTSEFATAVKVDGYVHGASFSHDRTRLLMAVGNAEQKTDLDLIVYDLEAGKVEQRLAGVLRGTIPTSEMDGRVMTIPFADDGRQATFFMRKNDQELTELRYRYDWKTGAVHEWNPPVPADVWSGYTQTDDGMYQMYPNAGIFKGTEPVLEFPGNGPWIPIPGSHQFVYLKYEPWNEGQEHTQSLYMFDADRKQERVLTAGLRPGLFLLGTSKDGNWLYLVSSHDLTSLPTSAP